MSDRTDPQPEAVEQPQKRKPQRASRQRKSDAADILWNILTGMALFLALVAAGFFLLIYRDPKIKFNPYPPPTQPALIVIPSKTPITPTLPPTATPQPTETVTVTFTPTPTYTPTVTATMIGRGPTATASATSSVRTAYSFALKSDPAALNAIVLNPDRTDCKWMGVAGQVQDLKGGPAVGISVLAGGSLGGYQLTLYPSLTGTALNYGTAGYEITLGDHPIPSKGAVWVQLLDQQRLPLSPRVYFDTFDDCQHNLIIVNFQQVR